MVAVERCDSPVVATDRQGLLGSREEDIAYYYASRLKNEPLGPEGGSYHDLEWEVTMTARF